MPEYRAYRSVFENSSRQICAEEPTETSAAVGGVVSIRSINIDHGTKPNINLSREDAMSFVADILNILGLDVGMFATEQAKASDWERDLQRS